MQELPPLKNSLSKPISVEIIRKTLIKSSSSSNKIRKLRSISQIHPQKIEEKKLMTKISRTQSKHSSTNKVILKNMKFGDDNSGTLEDGRYTQVEYEKLLVIETGNLILASIGIILSVFSVQNQLLLLRF